MKTIRSKIAICWILIAMVGLLALNGCAKVESGHAGILWTAWSGTQDKSFAEGWYFVAPWNKMYVYNIRTLDLTEDLHILANNGLSMKLETSVRFRAKAKELNKLHLTIGPDYYNVILAPIIRSAAREVGGRYTPEEIYSTKRSLVENEIFKETQKAAKGRPVELEAILVRNVDLPDRLKNAINEKLEEEQQAQKMKFTLVREHSEAERKRIAAHGSAERNRIITKSISEKLLRYKSIETTAILGNSPNTKVVLIGSEKDGLPIILGNQ